MVTIKSIIISALVGIGLTHSAACAELWLSGLDPITRAAHKDGGESDFMQLFTHHSKWARAASKIQVLKVSAQFLMRGSDSDLSTMFNWLGARQISLAVEMGFLSGDGRCGIGMEGYAAPRTGEVMAKRVQRLGGKLEYVAMDEQLWFGKFAKTKTACHSSTVEIAKEVAEKSQQMRRVFPDIRVGDIEPFGVPADIPWSAEIKEWLTAYRTAAGRDLEFLHADVQWSGDWQTQLAAAAGLSKESDIPFGVIVNAGRPVRTDMEWTAGAEHSLSKIFSLLGGMPDQVVVQSWAVNPRRYLPEDQSGTVTSVIERFEK